MNEVVIPDEVLFYDSNSETWKPLAPPSPDAPGALADAVGRFRQRGGRVLIAVAAFAACGALAAANNPAEHPSEPASVNLDSGHSK